MPVFRKSIFVPKRRRFAKGFCCVYLIITAIDATIRAKIGDFLVSAIDLRKWLVFPLILAPMLFYAFFISLFLE
jgi:hypothetical protein